MLWVFFNLCNTINFLKKFVLIFYSCLHAFVLKSAIFLQYLVLNFKTSTLLKYEKSYEHWEKMYLLKIREVFHLTRFL